MCVKSLTAPRNGVNLPLFDTGNTPLVERQREDEKQLTVDPNITPSVLRELGCEESTGCLEHQISLERGDAFVLRR